MPDFILSGEVFDFVRLPAVRLENTASGFFWVFFFKTCFMLLGLVFTDASLIV